MKGLLPGLAVLPFLAGLAMAQPISLKNAQMDGVTAGGELFISGLIEQFGEQSLANAFPPRPHVTGVICNCACNCPNMHALPLTGVQTPVKSVTF
ncbi:MAG TPA: hypothetical protein VJ770_29945 [Stellaceae bacterium]|nr:hypothetical protein [Stellaceae bacterium]